METPALISIFSKSFDVFKRNWVVYTIFAVILFLLKYATNINAGSSLAGFIFGSLLFIIGLIANYVAISGIVIYTLHLLEKKPLTIVKAVQRVTVRKTGKVMLAVIVRGLIQAVFLGVFAITLLVLVPTMFDGVGFWLFDIVKILILAVLIIPNAIITARFSFIIPSILEGHTMWGGFKESWKISQGHVWYIWTNFFMMMLIVFAGALCLVVGVIPATALAMIMNMRLYLALRDVYRYGQRHK